MDFKCKNEEYSKEVQATSLLHEKSVEIEKMRTY